MTELKKITGTKVEKAGTTGICAGANLRTPCGPRRVEYLRQGDLVVTRDNGLQPVRMIWTRTVTASEIAADPSLAPVTLKPRAIAPMMPQKEVAVGGGHRLLIPGWRLGDENSTENSLVAQRDFTGHFGAGFFAHKGVETGCQLALGGLGVGGGQCLGNHKAQHAVAQKFQALVVGSGGRGQRRVRECADQQFGRGEPVAQPALKGLKLCRQLQSSALK